MRLTHVPPPRLAGQVPRRGTRAIALQQTVRVKLNGLGLDKPARVDRYAAANANDKMSTFTDAAREVVDHRIDLGGRYAELDLISVGIAEVGQVPTDNAR